MKNNFYFQHDSNSRNDEKILELRAEFGLEGYAVFFMLLESMSETKDGWLSLESLGGLGLGYGLAKARLETIINRCFELKLLVLEGKRFTSNRMLSHLAFREKLSEAGKKGAKRSLSTRVKNSQALATLKPGSSHPSTKERKVNTFLTERAEALLPQPINSEESFIQKRGRHFFEEQQKLDKEKETNAQS